MKAKVTLTLELRDQQLYKVMKHYGYPDDFEPIEVKEALQGLSQKSLNEILIMLHIGYFWDSTVEVEE